MMLTVDNVIALMWMTVLINTSAITTKHEFQIEQLHKYCIRHTILYLIKTTYRNLTWSLSARHIMSDMKEHFEAAIRILKPACDAFITDPNVVNTNLLKDAMVIIPENILEYFHPYIMIPLEIHFKTKKLNCTLNILDVLTTLLEYTSINLPPTFMRIYTMLIRKLADRNHPGKVLSMSEDIKLSIIITLNLLIQKSNIIVLNQIYNEVDCKSVGYLIYICTKIIIDEKMNILRVEAIKCIEILSSSWDKNTDLDNRLKVIQSLTKFVPGILSICSFAVNATDIQHHSVTVAALNLWSTITSLIICDNHVIEDCNPYLGKELLSKNENEDKKKLNDWIQENSVNFNLVTSCMKKTREHEHWRVRLQLVSSCDVLLTKCTSSMRSSITDLIETLIILSDDEQPEVEKIANESVNKLHKTFNGQNKKHLIELLEESFYNLLSRIPRFIRTSNYIKQKAELSLLCGYIKLFGKTHLTRVLNSYAHLDRLTTVLIQILELEYKTIRLLEESSIRDLNNVEQFTVEMTLNVPWKQLIHFNDTSALYKIENICKLIGLYGDCNFIGRYLMDLFESKMMYRREITLLMNMILAENNRDECHYSIVRDVIELYLEHDIWYLSTCVDKNCTTNIADVQKNVVQICLMTEGLAQLVSSLDMTKQNLCLIHCLYPILERVGSELCPISLAGQRAITILARSGGYKDPIDLVVKNSDYLSHHFTTRLWSLSDYPEVLNALKVVMNLNSSDDLLRSFHTIVTDVLVQSCDVHRTENMNSFMKVFHIFVMCVNKWQRRSLLTTTETVDKSKPLSDCVVENILEFHKMMTMDLDDAYWESKNNCNISCENNKSIEEEEEEDGKKPLPPYIQMVISIMTRVLKFLPLKHQFLPLQILNEGLKVISNYENHLLPMVHKIWSPLCTKFNNNTDDIIFCEAFNVLTTMASAAKDFIRSRSLKQVLPTIVDRLISSAKDSKNVSKGSVYFTSHRYKMQYTILSGLGDFVLNLNFIEKDMYDVSTAVSHYLDNNQPTALQEKSKDFYKILHLKHSDFVWIYLQSLHIEEYEYKSENIRLPSIKVCGSLEMLKSNVSKNVSELLELLNV